jgi:chemotaxis protein MotB
MKLILVASALLFVTFLSSCVSQKKFDELLAERVGLEADNAELLDQLTAANGRISEFEKEVKSLNSETKDQGEKIVKLESELQDLQEEHSKLETYYNNLLTNSGKLNRDIAEQQERLLALQANLDTKKQENEILLADLEAREKKVKELETAIEEKDKAVKDLMAKVKQALLNFSGNDLSVEIRNGKVYVSMASQLLFKTASYNVDPKGESALIQLAEALKTSQDVNVVVEGHTDNVPISSKSIKDNWDLSVLRATSITRVLTRAGVDPTRISATGRSSYLPVASNDSNDGKAKNRRTEIILTPDLDELFQILETN